MIKPVATSIPSESTIEQLSNHWIMNLLNPSRSWVFVPTKNQEKFLGYDASLQGYKALLIQYKRFSPTKTGGTININKQQHATLIRNFPKMPTPYVFYGLSTFRNYSDIASIHTAGNGIDFCRKAIFFDIHSIGLTKKSISTSWLKNQCIKTYDIYEITEMFKDCNVGILAKNIEEIPRNDSAERSSSRINVLWSKI